VFAAALILAAGMASAGLLKIYDTADSTVDADENVTFYLAKDAGLDNEYSLQTEQPQESNLTVKTGLNASFVYRAEEEISVGANSTELVNHSKVSENLEVEEDNLVLDIGVTGESAEITLGESKVVADVE
jgi:hypothetical protein